MPPVDQFRAFLALSEKGLPKRTSPRFLRHAAREAAAAARLGLARLLEIYAEEMSLEQVMAFTVSPDHARQEQVWEALRTGPRSPIRSAVC